MVAEWFGVRSCHGRILKIRMQEGGMFGSVKWTTHNSFGTDSFRCSLQSISESMFRLRYVVGCRIPFLNLVGSALPASPSRAIELA